MEALQLHAVMLCQRQDQKYSALCKEMQLYADWSGIYVSNK